MKAEQLPLGVVGPVTFHSYEEESYSHDFKSIAGIDEVGRGPLAGPVVAAAVILPRGYAHAEIEDSKLLTSKQRDRLAPRVRENATCWGVGDGEVGEVDRLRTLQASVL